MAGGASVDPAGFSGDGDKPTTAAEGNVEWDPYVIWTEDRCSTIGTDLGEIEARARRQLENQTSHLIEAILATNTVDGVDYGVIHPNVGFEAGIGNVTTPNAWDAYPIVTAFKDMIEALGAALGGVRGMIHVPARMIPFLAFYGMAVQSGTRLVTTLGDHIVVPGTGYTGSDPDRNLPGEFHAWIYGTTMIEVLLAPIDVFTDRAGAVNRSTNLVEYRAERMALAHWDRQAHIGIPVCLEDPAGDCSDSGS